MAGSRCAGSGTLPSASASSKSDEPTGAQQPERLLEVPARTRGRHRRRRRGRNRRRPVVESTSSGRPVISRDPLGRDPGLGERLARGSGVLGLLVDRREDAVGGHAAAAARARTPRHRCRPRRRYVPRSAGAATAAIAPVAGATDATPISSPRCRAASSTSSSGTVVVDEESAGALASSVLMAGLHRPSCLTRPPCVRPDLIRRADTPGRPAARSPATPYAWAGEHADPRAVRLRAAPGAERHVIDPVVVGRRPRPVLVVLAALVAGLVGGALAAAVVLWADDRTDAHPGCRAAVRARVERRARRRQRHGDRRRRPADGRVAGGAR